MPNVLVACADAVVDALNADPQTNFGQVFEAERSYADWELALEDDSNQRGQLKVDVVPVGQLATDIETRATLNYSPAVDVVVRVGLGPERRQADGKFTLEEIDALVLLVQGIAEFFSINRIGADSEFSWNAEVGTKILAAYKPTHLRQNHQFTGVVRIPFYVSQELT